MFDEPIGRAIEDAARSDLVRGVVFTDALIGTFARADDPTLQQNICFLKQLQQIFFMKKMDMFRLKLNTTQKP